MYFFRFIIFSLLLTFLSCDDGDIVVSNFEFDTDDMDFCSIENSGETVFYNYNSSSNEVVYAIISDEFDGQEEFSDVYTISENSDSNTVQFIKFNAPITPTNYFCSSVVSPVGIESESTGTNGEILVETRNTISLDEDEDSDGLSNLLEIISDTISETDLTNLEDSDGEIDLNQLIEDFGDLKDSDFDGLPDFRDEDDDNDNVNTSLELYEKDDDGNDIDEDENGNDITTFLDTDTDSIPDYLDDDDDGDGVPTRLEFKTEDNTNPRNSENKNENESQFLYLDFDSNIEGTHVDDIILSNSYTTSFETIVTTKDLKFTSGSTSVTPTLFIIGETNENLTVEHRVLLKSDGRFETFLVLDDLIEDELIDEGTIGQPDDEDN